MILAESGDPEAQYQWANRMMEGGSLENDTERAEIYSYLNQASNAEFRPARIQLSQLLLNGTFGNARKQEGLATIELLAREGLPEYQSKLALLYTEGELVEQDQDRAAELFRLAAGKDDPYATYWVANEELKDLNLSKDRIQKLESTLETSGKSGVGEAFFVLAQRADSRKDAQTAESLYYKAAKLGHPQSMYRTGIAYLRKGNHPTYAPLGFEFLSKALDGGATDALFALSVAYDKGLGSQIDKEKAVELERSAALLKSVKAISSILDKALEKESWDYEESINIAAWRNWGKGILSPRQLLIGERLPFSDEIFFELVDHRIKQYQLQAKVVRSNYDSRAPKLSEEENEFLQTSYEERYQDRKSLYLAARSDPTGKRQLEFSKILLEQDRSDAEILKWIRASSLRENPDAGVFLYKAYIDKRLETTEQEALQQLARSTALKHPEAVYLESQRLLENANSHGQYIRTIHFLLDSSEQYPEVDKQIRDLLENRKGVETRDPRIRSYMEKLANEGNLYIKYLLESYKLMVYESNWEVTSFLSVNHAANEIVQSLGYGTSNYLLSGLDERTRTATKIENLEEGILSSVKAIEELAAKEQYEASICLSIWKYFGYYGKTDQKVAYNLWKNVHSRTPTADTFLILGICKYTGFHETKDYELASDFIRSAAEKDSEYAASFFSDLDKNVEPNTYLFDTIYRAKKLKNAESMYVLGAQLKADNRLSEKESAQGYLKWIGEAAKNGHAEAMQAIGIAFFEGDGVERNRTRAIRYLEQSAKLGLEEAQYYTGFFYAMGEDIPQDLDKAVTFLEMAADQGNVKAQNLLSNIRTASTKDSLNEEPDGAIRNLFVASVFDEDHFPISPKIVADGKAHPIVDVRQSRPMFLQGKKKSLAKQETSLAIFAAEDFASQKVEITRLEYSAPVVSSEGGIVYTGQEASSTFFFIPDSMIDNCLALLVYKEQGNYSYIWKRVGKLQPDKEYIARFKLNFRYFNQENLAIYFFNDGKEVLSNGRRQLQFFIDSGLKKFTDSRDKLTEESTKSDKNPSLFKDLKYYVSESGDSISNIKVTLHISKYGYVKSLNISGTKDTTILNSLIQQLSRATVYPKIIGGKPSSSKIAYTFN